MSRGPETARSWEIGICGTFDVANYGDLLFPLIAEAELTERLGPVTLHRFSYGAKSQPEWPYEVTSVSELPRMVNRLGGLLIGGGHLIRFDKHVAPGYGPPSSEIHHPTGFWLTPALLALQHDVPLVWNAPGVVCPEIPRWANPLLSMALTLSRYVAVRDESSRSVLEPLTGAPVAVVADTAFGVRRLVNLEGPPSLEFTRLAQAVGLLDGPYLILQASPGLDAFVRFHKHHRARFAHVRVLVLPIGPVLGDDQEFIDADLPGVIRLRDWPTPLVIAELIGRSEAVIGQSYHLFITALAAGVPVFTPQNLATGKYSALQPFETIFGLPDNGEPDVDWFLVRIGKTTPSAAVRAWNDQLRHHWDRVAAAFQGESPPTATSVNRFWQSLPGLLENAAAQLDDALEAVSKARVLDLQHISQHRLETDPFQWAAIEEIFTPGRAAELAATYPRDHFKLVAAADDGEKGFEYRVRALIEMGSDVVAHPRDLSDTWRALATDLLTPEYRAAMTTLTGCDLTQAQMEVNVFHYGPGDFLGAHRDLPDKIVTHVLYFNESWNSADGGCLSILRSADPADLAAEIVPIVGTSAIIVRSERSWHAVSRVVNDSASSRRSVTVTFYRPGSVSTLWPPDDRHDSSPSAPDGALEVTTVAAVDGAAPWQIDSVTDIQYRDSISERDAEIRRLQEVLAEQTDWNVQLRDHAARTDAEVMRLQKVLAEQTDWNVQLRDHAARTDAEVMRTQEVLAEQTDWNLQLRGHAATTDAEIARLHGRSTPGPPAVAPIRRALRRLHRLLGR